MKPEPDMDDKPRSVWRRPLKGWRGLAGWWVVLFFALFVLILLLSWVSQPTSVNTAKLYGQPFLISIVGSVLLVLLAAFARWLRSWRNFRRFLFGLACLATLIALFYAEENIRGKLAWNRYVHEVEARGETLDLAKLIPPPVPDDQNFTLCPLLKPVFNFTWQESADPADLNGRTIRFNDTNGLARLGNLDVYSAVENYVNSLPSKDVRAQLGDRMKAIRAGLPISNGWVNLQGFEDYLLLGTNLNGVTLTDSAASNVLLALEPFDADLDALKDCSRRRALDRWSILYETNAPYVILLPHLAKVKQFCQFLQLPASAKLATGDTAGAIEDMKLAHRFAESPRDEPFVISQLVRVASHRINVQPLKEGLARHQFTEAQLKKLEEQYHSADILSGAAMSMRGERACGPAMVRAVRENPALLAFLANGFQPVGHDASGLKRLAKCAPSGWYYQNAKTICRLYDLHALPALDEIKKRVWPKTAESLEPALDKVNPVYGALAQFLVMPASRSGGLVKCAEGQTLMDQAEIACALERYHLADGRYPETLAVLSPRFLETVPHDVITGEPMSYRTLPDGRYILYSVGRDGNDDGGTPIQGERYDPKGNEDWVWQLPDPRLQPY